MSKIKYKDAWNVIEKKGINKLLDIIDSSMDDENKDKQKMDNKTFVKLYTIIYDICSSDDYKSFSELLYNDFIATIKKFVENYGSKLKNSTNERSIDFIIEYNNFFENYNFFSKWMLKIFSYLNRHYVKKTEKLNLEVVCANVFNEEIFSKVYNLVIKSLQNLINQSRDKSSFEHRNVILSCVKTYQNMKYIDNVYKEHFEKPLLFYSKNYYIEKSAEWSLKEDIEKIALKIDKCIKFENNLFTSITNESKKRLNKIILKSTLGSQQNRFLESDKFGILILIRQKDLKKLKLMYDLFKNLSSDLPIFSIEFEKSLILLGSELITKIKNKEDLVFFFDDLIDLYNYILDLISNVFNKDIILEKRMSNSFTEILNDNYPNLINISKEYSFYIGSFLNKEKYENSKMKLIYNIDKTLILLPFIPKKEDFFNIYHSLLANRIGFNRSIDKKYELETLAIIKKLCGTGFSITIERMLADLDITEKIKKIYQNLNSKKNKPFKININIVSRNYWPKYKNIKCNFPESLKKEKYIVDNFYSQISERRVLNWPINIGRIKIKANFKNGSVLIISTIIQASILTLINSMNSVSIEEIGNILSVPLDELKIQLKALVHKKYYRILLKTPTKGYSINHVLSANLDCKPNTNVIDLPIPNKVFE